MTRRNMDPMLPYPDYDFDPRTWTGELREPFRWHTNVKGHSAHALFLELDEEGWLTIEAGYVWDFGSGPAIDTPDMVVASLVHDAGCDLTAEGALPWKCRRMFDKEFRRVLRKYGTPAIRRWYCWAAVRLDAVLSRLFSDSSLRPRRRLVSLSRRQR